ncbi:hypothetical protein GGD83_002826 [Rhodoblastus sphagnicola]|nr:hypothetical protein [Rhodoblastus sphagnicola]
MKLSHGGAEHRADFLPIFAREQVDERARALLVIEENIEAQTRDAQRIGFRFIRFEYHRVREQVAERRWVDIAAVRRASRAAQAVPVSENLNCSLLPHLAHPGVTQNPKISLI